MENKIDISKLNDFAGKVLERAFVVESLGKDLYAVLHGEKEETLTGMMYDFREMGDDYVEEILRLYRLQSVLNKADIECNVFDLIAYYMYELWDDADIAKKMPNELIYTMMNLSEFIKNYKEIWKEELSTTK